MTLPAFDPFTPTGVGSLPHTDVERAVDRVLDHAAELPYAPQLPRRSTAERMVAQTAEGLPGIRIDPESGWAFVEGISIPGTGTIPEVGEPGISRDVYPGLYALLERLSRSGRTVKVQLTGPVTVATRTTDGRGRRAIYDPGWRGAAAEAIGGKGAVAARLVREAGCEPVIQIDEPLLWSAEGAQAALTRGGAARLVSATLERIDAPRIVHCCSLADWDLLFDLPVDAVSFDAHRFGDEAVGSGAVERLLARDASVVWGVVPASGAAVDETVPGLVGRLRYHLNKLESAGIEPERAASRSLVSPTCGLGTLSEEVAGRVLELLSQVAAALHAA